MLNLFIAVFFFIPLIPIIDCVIHENFELELVVIMRTEKADVLHDNNKGIFLTRGTLRAYGSGPYKLLTLIK